MELGEVFPAVRAAETAVMIEPLWAEAHQTVGRSQISIGEIEMVRMISTVNFNCNWFVYQHCL